MRRPFALSLLLALAAPAYAAGPLSDQTLVGTATETCRESVGGTVVSTTPNVRVWGRTWVSGARDRVDYDDGGVFVRFDVSTVWGAGSRTFSIPIPGVLEVTDSVSSDWTGTVDQVLLGAALWPTVDGAAASGGALLAATETGNPATRFLQSWTEYGELSLDLQQPTYGNSIRVAAPLDGGAIQCEWLGTVTAWGPSLDGDGFCQDNDLTDADGDGTVDDCETCLGDEAAGDTDDDGLCDDLDVCPAGDDLADADGDGAADACDACPDDLLNDGDGDGSCDNDDPCPMDPEDDADGDGACAEADPCPYDPDDDLDGDGVCGDLDACPEDAANDADGDGVCGDADRCAAGNDALDADGDGAADACDRCPDDPANDADGDGACADIDPCPLDAADDSDRDGSCDSDDPCALDADDDLDLDGMCGDVDPCPVDLQNDADGDGVCEADDVCPTLSDSAQLDTDHDGVGDACEPDGDGDGVSDDLDNCPLDANTSQADRNADGIGDACEADGDADGISDDLDRCAGTAAGAVTDDDGCSVDQHCPCDGSWKNRGAYQSCVARVSGRFVAEGYLTSAQKGAVVSAAATRSCGGR